MIADIAEDVQQMNLSDVIREAAKKGLLKNSWDQWWSYRDNRNATSHGYNEQRAIEIVEKLPVFYHECLFLIKNLKEQNEVEV